MKLKHRVDQRDETTKVAVISLGNIAHPSLSEPVEPCRPAIMSVRNPLADAPYILGNNPLIL